MFSTAFFLMKEFTANRKLIPLTSFMEKVLGISPLKHFSYRSQGSVREIYLTLGDTVKPSSETQGQIVGARESLTGGENMARRKVKNGEKSPPLSAPGSPRMP